jgi:hypothetical protein
LGAQASDRGFQTVVRIEDTRLVLVSREGAAQLAQHSPAELRRIACQVAEVALSATALESPFALDLPNEAARAQLRERLEREVEQLDAIYFDLADAREAGNATEQQVLAAFSRARALHSAWFALSPDPIEAAAEASYEAQASMGSLSALELALGWT